MSLLQHLRPLPDVAVIYTDLDGTLLGRGGSVLADGDGRPSVAGVTALVAARRAGIAVVGVSGRRAASLAHDARLLGLDGAIAEVGTVLIRDGVHHFRWGECPPDLAATPRGALEAVGAVQVLLDGFPGDLRPYDPWDAGREGGHLLHGRIDVGQGNRLLAQAGIGWAKVVDNGRASGWEGRSDVHAYHLVARGVGKAEALAEDLRWRGLAPDTAMAIGDSVEDRTMARSVATYVMVANAAGTAEGNCFRVAGRHGDGVAEAITAALDARADHRPPDQAGWRR
ncbi:MAG TPA: HAD hydrolase family protein [Euzebya sp.]|nr:HAD hydrolase family protein [Euzebya sp.]